MTTPCSRIFRHGRLALGLAASIIFEGCGEERVRDEAVPTESRYTISIEGSHPYTGAQGHYRVIEVVDRKLSRKYVVLESSGSVNPPRINDQNLSSSMTLLSKSQEGSEK